MSTKSTIKYGKIKGFMFHLYEDELSGCYVDISLNGEMYSFPVSEEQADDLKKQLEG